MIAVLMTMLRARWAQAVTVFVLSVVATAAAVAGPVALRVVDSAVVRNEVADATTAERSLTLVGGANPSDPAASSQFDTFAGLIALPGFSTVRAGQLRAFGPAPTGDRHLTASTSRVVFRDQICQHIVIVAGRCLAGTFDILVGADSAKRAGLSPGQRVDLQAEAADPNNGQPVPDGAVGTYTIAGIYRPIDPGEAYWAAQYYFPERADGTRDEAVFVTVQTFDLVDHTKGTSFADSLAPPGALTPQNLDATLASIAGLTEAAANNNSGFTLSTGIPELVDRIRQGQALAHELVPVAFLPLVGLSWFVVFLAVGYGVNGRRHEIGLVNLRGVRLVRRWWLAIGESVLMIILGAPVGYLVGYLVVALLSRLRLDGAQGAGIGTAEVPYAAVALGGALLVALLGQRRALREPVSDLLRGVPRSSAAWRSTVVEAVPVLLAVLGVLQLRDSGGLTGVSLIVPGLVVVAVTLLAARAFVPVAGLVARTSLRRGHLGLGLAAVQIARRPGSQRLFTLLAVATGLLAFVAAGQSVAAQARDERAGVSVGAATVVTVDRNSTQGLLFATHKVDPAGAWAMAAMPLTQSSDDDPPALAVDSGRLGTVADWQSQFGVSAAAVAAALRPPAADPFVLRGDAFTVDLNRAVPSSDLVDTDGDGIPDSPPAISEAPVTLVFQFESLVDGSAISSSINVVMGRHTYAAQTAGCASGCRLSGFNGNAGSGVSIALTLYGVHAADGDVVPPAALTRLSRWRGVGQTEVSPVTDGGLRIQLAGNVFDTGDIVVSTIDAPVPVPVVVTEGVTAPRMMSGVDGRPVAVKAVSAGAPLTMLPRLGTRGVLVDLDYLQRVGLATRAASGEVWLGPAAPPDALDRLRHAGLTILSSRSTADAQAGLDRAGPALALQFHLAAGVLSVGLALGGLWLVAAVDRRRRADDLTALRQQGMRRRIVRRAALWGYLWLVFGSAVAGLLAAAAAWAAAGDHLPILTEAVAALPPPRWPALDAVLVPWALATAGMVAVAVAVAVVLGRAVRLTRNGRARNGEG